MKKIFMVLSFIVLSTVFAFAAQDNPVNNAADTKTSSQPGRVTPEKSSTSKATSPKNVKNSKLRKKNKKKVSQPIDAKKTETKVNSD